MSKFNEAEMIRKKIVNLQENLERAQNELEAVERTCHHSWPNRPEYIPEYYEGYTSPGDPPGTMGVDWRGPTYVPAKTIKKWRRKCSLCGKTEITDRVKVNTIHTEEPRF